MALAESTSMPMLAGRIPVLAIKKSDERFAILDGIQLEDVEKVMLLKMICFGVIP